MTKDKLNKYILNYLKNDKTKSAIMLDGNWGVGKSYYVENELAPFIRDQDDYKCIVVSLYGLKDVFEISHNIYWELRGDKIKKLKKGEKIESSKIIAKTIFKNVLNKVGIDLSISNKDLNKLYNSLELSKVLIVLEDIERTQINLLSLLGYVNNMTEHDGAKVLLIANEKELLKYEKTSNCSETDKATEKDVINCSEEVKQYLREKEKTISETISFSTDLNSALINIINSFHNKILIKYAEEEFIEIIKSIMYTNGNYNLRSFIYACQKSVEIYSKVQNENNEDFYDCIFYGILSFSLKIKKGKVYNWRAGDLLSTELGYGKYPLLKLCYDYITIHEIYYGEIEFTRKRLEELRLYDDKKSLNDKDLRIIYNYFAEKEEDVLNAVKSIEVKLNNPNTISFYDYGKIAVYLIAISDLLEIDISKIKKLLVNNLKGRANIIQGDTLFASTLHYDKESLYKELDDIKDQMYKALNCNQRNIDYDYKPENVVELKKYIKEHKSQISIMREFASKLNIPHMVELFLNGTAKQMHEYRGAFLGVYQDNRIIIDFGRDKQALILLLEGIKRYKEYNIDKIQIQQCEWFIGNLKKIIQQMN